MSGMDKAVFISKRMFFERDNAVLKDLILGRMSMDIEVGIKTTAGTPVKTGGMKSEVRHFKSGNDEWRVEAGKGYSAYQERGARADGSHRVRRYTTAGTSAGWFQRAIGRVLINKRSYIEEAKRALGLL